MNSQHKPVISIERDHGGNTLLGQQEIDEVVAAALVNGSGRARINAHRSLDAEIHEMVIAFRGGSYVRPHRHRSKRESFHVIAGRIDAVVFDDQGTVKQRLKLGAYGSEFPFYLRSEHNDWHCFVVVSDLALVHETTNGPFRQDDSEFPTWAPNPDDEESIRIFLNRIG